MRPDRRADAVAGCDDVTINGAGRERGSGAEPESVPGADSGRETGSPGARGWTAGSSGAVVGVTVGFTAVTGAGSAGGAATGLNGRSVSGSTYPWASLVVRTPKYT